MKGRRKWEHGEGRNGGMAGMEYEREGKENKGRGDNAAILVTFMSLIKSNQR